MPYFLCSNCPMSLGTSVAGPALLLGTETYCLSLPAHQTVPSAPAHSHFLFQGICSAPERSRQVEGLHLHLPSLFHRSLHVASYPLCSKNQKGEGRETNKQTNNSLAANRRHTDHLQIVFLRNMCRASFSAAFRVTALQ